MDRLLDYIEKLKQRPEHIRRRYAFVVSFVITFVIFAGWIGSSSLKSSPVLSQNIPSKEGEKAKVERPLSSLTASVKDAFKDVKDIFVGTNKLHYSSESNIEVTPGKR